MYGNYIQNLMNTQLEGCKIIPFNWAPTKKYSASFSGWGNYEFVCDDPTFSEIIQIMSHTLSGIISVYKDTHAFSEPEIIYKPDKHIFCIQIATLEIEQYNRLMEFEDN